MDADRIVRDFCAAWGRADLEAIMAAFSEDAVYHNIPMDPLRGHHAIRTFIGGLFATNAKGVDFDIRHQIVSGRVVMNERVDTLEFGGKTVELPVCGVFKLAVDGRIAAWRDYFDAAQFTGA